MLTLEALIVGALLIVAVENTMAAVSASSDLSGHQKHMTEALHVGQTVMESLMLAYDTDVNLASGMHSLEFDAEGNQLVGGQYTANWKVTADSPYPRIRTIEVTMNWVEHGVTRAAVFTSYRN